MSTFMSKAKSNKVGHRSQSSLPITYIALPEFQGKVYSRFIFMTGKVSKQSEGHGQKVMLHNSKCKHECMVQIRCQ